MKLGFLNDSSSFTSASHTVKKPKSSFLIASLISRNRSVTRLQNSLSKRTQMSQPLPKPSAPNRKRLHIVKALP